MHHIEDWFSEADRYELLTGHEGEEALRLYYKLGYTIFKNKNMGAHFQFLLKKSATKNEEGLSPRKVRFDG